MRKQPLISAALLGLVGAIAGWLLPQQSAHAQIVGGPLPPVPTPPDLIHARAHREAREVHALRRHHVESRRATPAPPATPRGRALLRGSNRSSIEGGAAARGRARPVRPAQALTYAYAAFSPEGPYYDTQNAVWIGGNFWDGRAYDTSVQAQVPRSTPTR